MAFTFTSKIISAFTNTLKRIKSYLLKEDGFKLLLEDGGKILIDRGVEFDSSQTKNSTSYTNTNKN